jgi:hypothetical protein
MESKHMKQLSAFTVELENEKLIHKPSFLFASDCRICALINVVCEDLEYPCIALTSECNKNILCNECEQLENCLEKKPCCWKCKHLFECLDYASEWASEFVKHIYDCTWEDYVKAIRLLKCL